MQTSEILPVGKLPMDLLQSLLSRYAAINDRVIIGPEIGEDTAVIDMGDRYLVAKTDPITFATDEIGIYAVNVNANDLACAGATPRWFLATTLLPEGRTDIALVESIFAQLSQACKELGISLCGGHTEITYGLDRPIVIGHLLGEVTPDRLVHTAGAQVGDVLLLTKALAIEGTAVIARERAEELLQRHSPDFVLRCQKLLHEPGISIVREAALICAHCRPHAMHDPTEGGLATGLRELAIAAGVGLQVEAARIPILPETARLCADYGLDPLGLLASGALLAALAPADVLPVLSALHEANLDAVVIGRVVPADQGLTMVTAEGAVVPLPVFARDELARLFG